MTELSQRSFPAAAITASPLGSDKCLSRFCAYLIYFLLTTLARKFLSVFTFFFSFFSTLCCIQALTSGEPADLSPVWRTTLCTTYFLFSFQKAFCVWQDCVMQQRGFYDPFCSPPLISYSPLSFLKEKESKVVHLLVSVYRCCFKIDSFFAWN